MPDVLSTHEAAGELVLLHPRRHAALVAALDAAAAADPTLAAARARLLAPLSLLEAMAREAEGALGDDVLAAERLRLLLAMGSAQVTPTAGVRETVLGAGGERARVSALAAGGPLVPCDDGILHLGTLVIVGLAAGRVGRATGLAEPLVQNVLELAIAAGPAEAISRALAGGMDAAQLRALLHALSRGEGAGEDRRLSTSIAAYLADPCERARWFWLDVLFQAVRRDVRQTTWDAAGTGSLLRVEPRAGCPGDLLTLHLQPPVDIVPERRTGEGEPGEPALDAVHFLPLLQQGAALVVFAAHGHPPVAALPESADAPEGTVTVRVPEGAHAGWIGFADPALLERSNADRAALRALWAERNDLAALLPAPVPAGRIPLLPSPPTPPRVPQGRFDGGAPVVLAASLEPAVVDPGGTLRLAWRVAGAGTVAAGGEAVEAEGTRTLVAPGDRSRLTVELVAAGACGDPVRRELEVRVRVRIRRVAVLQPERGGAVPLKIFAAEGEGPAAPRAGRPAGVRGADLRLSGTVLVEGEEATVEAVLSAPDAPGEAELRAGDAAVPMRVADGVATATLPRALAVDGLAGTVIYRGPDGEVEDRRDFGPLRFAALRTRALVVLRPAVVGAELRRATLREVEAAAAEARAAGIDVLWREPAWADDADLSLQEGVEGAEVPATLALLERLNALAARSPGFEERTWLAVVPTPASGGEFFRMEPADGARAVAVCTPGALGRLLAEEPPAAAARTARLRIVATLEGDGSVRLQPLRAEERAAGPGAPEPTELRAVGLDRAGRVRTSAPVRAMTADRPARAVVLLPLTEEVVALELRRPEAAVRWFRAAGDGEGAAPVRRVDRLPGAPRLPRVEGTDDGVSFDYSHSGSARASIVAEVGSERGWSPVLRVPPCRDAAPVAAGRLRAEEGDRLRLAATDGWNAVLAPGEGLPLPPGGRFAAARHAGGGLFWADVDAAPEEEVTWSFDGGEVRGPVAAVPAHYRGAVILTVGEGAYRAEDVRVIGPDGRVDDRSTELPEDGRHG